jgi:cytochrome c553
MHTQLDLRLFRVSLATIVWLIAFGSASAQSADSSAGSGVSSRSQAPNDFDNTYQGWRVFQANCARCHGPDAIGTSKAPDLLPRVKVMSQARFIGTVLQRYKWVLPASEGAGESGSPEVLIQGIMERKRGELLMPAWEGEPVVKAHVADLYDYLQARGRGALGPGQPQRPVR